ncbi:AAA family ATPase [Ectobacillus antri]|uniref:AAA family ATPase n=1 Tax=Ectobacillus antri TaxID=2486280 RepID=UPI000F5B7291|nr:AAA family ATPase [Ectobacillus antri]
MTDSIYYQANSDGSVAIGPQPEGPNKAEIIQTLVQALSINGWNIDHENVSKQPYVFNISAKERFIDVYIYCWRISNGGRASRPYEQRIQIGKAGEEGFLIDNSASPFKKGLLLGMYKKDGEAPIIVAWETEKNRHHGASKSCFVDIRTIAQAMRDGFVQTRDTDGNLICAFKKEFLNFYIVNLKNLHNIEFSLENQAVDYTPTDGNGNNVEEAAEETYNTLQKGINKIIYGAPGVGKSYRLGTANMRVTFHPEYTYFDFVGGLKPSKNDSGEISYDFVPGPFLRALKRAYDYPREMHTLVIEEINRANTAAVFGDIFQLLDRDENGWSEYFIENKEILDYLNSNRQEDKIAEVRIPGNLNLFATMNSADQGVFVMDSAFKRRWEFEYISISFVGATHAQEHLTYAGYKITWRDFATTVNGHLASALGVNEDKLIGPYFLKKEELADTNKIASKLLIYLWDDVVRHQREELFKQEYNTFSSVSEDFATGQKRIFVEELEQMLYQRRDVSEEVSEEE